MAEHYKASDGKTMIPAEEIKRLRKPCPQADQCPMGYTPDGNAPIRAGDAAEAVEEGKMKGELGFWKQVAIVLITATVTAGATLGASWFTFVRGVATNASVQQQFDALRQELKEDKSEFNRVHNLILDKQQNTSERMIRIEDSLGIHEITGTGSLSPQHRLKRQAATDDKLRQMEMMKLPVGEPK